MTPLQLLIINALKRIHSDGLCTPDTDCGCHLEDFAPCLDGPYFDCNPAIRLIIPEGDNDLIHPQTQEIVHHDGESGDWIMVPMEWTDEILLDNKNAAD